MLIWTNAEKRFQPMQDFTKRHNQLADYEPYFDKWTAEEMANVGLTLCYQVDAMMNKYLAKLERTFVTEGGIKERMHKARTGFRQLQDRRLKEAEEQLAEALKEIERLKAAYDDLKQRALKAYNEQEAEIARLKDLLNR